MKKLSEKSERGAAKLSKMLGEKAGKSASEAAASGDFGSDITRLALDYAFEEIWSRDGLDPRSRSLIVIGILIATAGALHELKNHFRIGIRHGLTTKELEEAVVQSLPYCGFARTSPAMSALIEVMRELNLDVSGKTSHERGLL